MQAFAFNEEKLRPLGGGTSGMTFVEGDKVLKNIGSDKEANWLTDAYQKLQSEKIRVPEPLLSIHGRYSEDGWITYRLLSGEPVAGNWLEKLSILRIIHARSSQLSWPDWMEARQDPWSLGHRIAWQRDPIPMNWNFLARNTISGLLEKCKKSAPACQVIHADVGGNFLFSPNLSPAIIDFSPAFEPPQYSEAIFAVDAFAWEQADIKSFPLEISSDFTECLIRATVFRLAVVAEFDFRNHSENFSKVLPNWMTALNVYSHPVH